MAIKVELYLDELDDTSLLMAVSSVVQYVRDVRDNKVRSVQTGRSGRWHVKVSQVDSLYSE